MDPRQRLPALQFRGFLQGREDDVRITDANFVAELQGSLVGLLAVDVGPGAGVQIADKAPAVGFEDDGMAGGDIRLAELHGAALGAVRSAAPALLQGLAAVGRSRQLPPARRRDRRRSRGALNWNRKRPI